MILHSLSSKYLSVQILRKLLAVIYVLPDASAGKVLQSVVSVRLFSLIF